MIIRSIPDTLNLSSGFIRRFTGTEWLRSLTKGLNLALGKPGTDLSLDMSEVEWVTLFEWTTVAAVLERVINEHPGLASVQIDLVGSSTIQLLSPEDYIAYERHETSVPLATEADYQAAGRVYQAAGFLESLGTLNVLNRPDRNTQRVFYPGLDQRKAALRSFHKARDGFTVLHGLMRINSKEDCKQFLDYDQVQNWRTLMQEKFKGSPIFESEELWRVLCHELAVNIYEHAEVNGFMSARVVESPFNKERLKPIWEATYGLVAGPVRSHLRGGFLELCVADAGPGIIRTLRDSYCQHIGQINTSDVNDLDVLAYAFDELGTRKRSEESWVTQRHALGRILHIVAKYGGVLRLRSGKGEVIYRSHAGHFERKPNHLGYEPQAKTLHADALPGVQLQVLLPLTPRFGKEALKQRRSVLDVSLPRGFRVESEQVRGHLVPILEAMDQKEACVTSDERLRFREKCEQLCRELLEKRPRSEPLVFDFYGLNWTAGQFETFLYMLQNLIQNRPVLVVEMHPELASDVSRLEKMSAPTELFPEILTDQKALGNPTFDEISERYFLETYNRIHSTLLAIDENGEKYIFGLPDLDYEKALLRLVDEELTIKDLARGDYIGRPLSEALLRAILTPANPLFRFDNDGRWRIIWDSRGLANEITRIMSRHFDAVAERNGAWLGRIEEKNAKNMPKSSKIFYLPWLGKWRKDFLSASKILSRERQSSEVAQRLIYRLKHGLRLMGRSIDDVKVLACISTPSMLLAAAMHRWWPTNSRPAIADLGYYVMLSDPEDLPVIAKSGSLVIVQDVLDTFLVSSNLVRPLREQGIDVLCVLAFVRLSLNINDSRVTHLNEGWLPNEEDNSLEFIPRHALVEAPRPEEAAPPNNDEDDSHAFWIEPRSLHAIRYPTLRREFKPGRDLYLERRDEYLRRFDNPDEGCLLTAGHYVFGRRHYAVTVDIRSALLGTMGDEIASWLADICEGVHERLNPKWESREGRSLKGGATAVLMPLHSQVHYVWPKVENLLAQRGRRQPNWWLEATLFTGDGPAYLIPDQVKYQIQQAVERTIDKGKPTSESDLIEDPVRILILDDAIATSRTAETILTTLLIELKDAFRKAEKRMETSTRPIEWIRYFAVLNQMNHTHHILWHNIPLLGKMRVPIVFEEFAPFMGVPLYDEKTCPFCRDRERIKDLSNTCERHAIAGPKQWIEARLAELKPKAVDSPDFQKPSSLILPRPIDVLAPRARPKAVPQKIWLTHADTAIWRFHELMYLSYPPNDVLRSLDYAWAPPDSSDEVIREYERYRWAVFEWCLHNWPRIIANAAREDFIDYSIKEFDGNSRLLESIVDGCSQYVTVQVGVRKLRLEHRQF